MRTVTTFILVEEETEQNLKGIATACERTAEARGFTDVSVTVAYAIPECIPDIPSEILHQAIETGAVIAIAFTDFNMPGVEEDGKQELHQSNEGTTQE